MGKITQNCFERKWVSEIWNYETMSRIPSPSERMHQPNEIMQFLSYVPH